MWMGIPRRGLDWAVNIALDSTEGNSTAIDRGSNCSIENYNGWQSSIKATERLALASQKLRNWGVSSMWTSYESVHLLSTAVGSSFNMEFICRTRIKLGSPTGGVGGMPAVSKKVVRCDRSYMPEVKGNPADGAIDRYIS